MWNSKNGPWMKTFLADMRQNFYLSHAGTHQSMLSILFRHIATFLHMMILKC